jgi:predicted nucleotidyltransferase
MDDDTSPRQPRTRQEKERALTALIAELRDDPAVSAVFLFGSHARGDGRTDSDIDLLVIAAGPFSRTVRRRDGVEFEVFRNNVADTVEFWRTHRDDFENFWRDARPLWDRDGAVARLRAAAAGLRGG